MAAPKSASIAYFTVVHDDRSGWTGGLLHLTPSGRPIEFQCTLPVRPSRTHEIMFGATLRGHVIVDVVGRLLVKKSRTPIQLLLCDQVEAMRLAEEMDCPVAFVDSSPHASGGTVKLPSQQGWETVTLADTEMRVAIEQADRVQEFCEQFNQLTDAIEPFDRIREAIKEAQSQIARPGIQAARPDNESDPRSAAA